MTTDDVRWKQRFDNFLKALTLLEEAVRLKPQRTLTDLELQGLVKRFEFTHELAWNVLKDYLEYAEAVLKFEELNTAAQQRGAVVQGRSLPPIPASVYQGQTFITGSRDATREAFNRNLIEDGETWMEMIKSRNLSSHTYDGEIIEGLVEKIVNSYYPLFVALKDKMKIIE
ncbi:MAG: nucleotidyltransferase substrate binding protein [Planctomycetaceae bacterium]|jgi:hypothetical protein|nr:nucleotidyltransferase substrate binding protein [Planctomycetaceae bacterium]